MRFTPYLHFLLSPFLRNLHLYVHRNLLHLFVCSFKQIELISTLTKETIHSDKTLFDTALNWIRRTIKSGTSYENLLEEVRGKGNMELLILFLAPDEAYRSVKLYI